MLIEALLSSYITWHDQSNVTHTIAVLTVSNVLMF